jgi:hypothetical protein
VKPMPMLYATRCGHVAMAPYLARESDHGPRCGSRVLLGDLDRQGAPSFGKARGGARSRETQGHDSSVVLSERVGDSC